MSSKAAVCPGRTSYSQKTSYTAGDYTGARDLWPLAHRSIPDRRAFAARVRAAREPDGLPVGPVLDGEPVGVAELRLLVDFVAHRRELGADRRGYPRFDQEKVRYHEAEAGRGDGLLDVHVEVDDVGEHLRRDLQDSAAARGSYRYLRLPVAHHEGRSEGVGDLTPGRRVEGVVRGLEARPPDLVVEPDAGPLRHHLAPEDVAQGLRRADDVPLPVSDDEVGGVLLRVGGGRRRVVRG